MANNSEEFSSEENGENEEELVDSESEFDSADEYYENLYEWTESAKKIHCSMLLFPLFVFQSFYTFGYENLSRHTESELGPTNATDAEQPPTRPMRVLRARLNDETNPRIILILTPEERAEPSNYGGYQEYNIAPLWKRFIAEVIDLLILGVFKFLIQVAVLKITGKDFSIISKLTDMLKGAFENDIAQFSNISSELFLEMNKKLDVSTLILLISIFYETIFVSMKGATPGKRMMNLEVLHVTHMEVLPQRIPENAIFDLSAIIISTAAVPLIHSFWRAVMKYKIMFLLFPWSFLFLFSKSNRLVYNLVTQSIVVTERKSRRRGRI